MDATAEFYTLLVNGQRPKATSTASFIHHDISCHPCPYGGRCLNGISAVPNFWGYVSGGGERVRFQGCPRGYCCASPEHCHTIDGCREDRVGVLCGQCRSNFSEAIFTADCVPNVDCNPTVGWPVMLCSGVLCFIFLLFQRDVRDLMFSRFAPLPIAADKRFKSPPTTTTTTTTTTKTEEFAAANPGTCGRHSDSVQVDPAPLLVSKDETSMADGNNTCQEGIQHVFANQDPEDFEPLRQDDGQPAPPTLPPSPPPDKGVSFLIIIFFYFQDAQLLHIKTVFASSEQHAKVVFREFLAGLFRFQIEIFQFMGRFCFLADLTPVKKMIVNVAFVPYILLQFGIVHVLHCWCNRSIHDQHQQPGFSAKLSTGFVLALLFTYQKLATTSFTLLNCVPVGDKSVLFVQGTIECYQPWQYAVAAYTATCIIPFCAVLLIGPGLLKDRLIGLTELFLAFLLPLPFLIHWFWLCFRRYRRIISGASQPDEVVDATPLGPEAKVVIQTLQGPFKDNRNRMFGSTCGQGMLIGRRLVLVLLYTFVNNTLMRTQCTMLLCFINLLHHVHVLPYRDWRGNAAGSASAVALVVVATINLLRAGFEAAEYVPIGPNARLMNVLEEVENCLMLWLPGAVMGFVVLLLTTKLVYLAVQSLCARCHISSCCR